MLRKIFAILLLPIVLTIAIGQGVFASDIEVEGTRVLGDGTSTQTVTGNYDPNSGEIQVTQTEDIQSGISNTILNDIIDTACAFRDIYCYKEDFNEDGKLDYVQLNKATGEVKYYEFAGTDTQLFSAKYATVDNDLRGTEDVLFSLPSKDFLGEPSNSRMVVMATKKGTTYRLSKVDTVNNTLIGFNLVADGADSGDVTGTNLTYLIVTRDGKKLLKYTGLHSEQSHTSGGDISRFQMMGTFEGLQGNHQTYSPAYGSNDGRYWFVGNKGFNIAYNQSYYTNSMGYFGNEIYEKGYNSLSIGLGEKIKFFNGGRMIVFKKDGNFEEKILPLDFSNQRITYGAAIPRTYEFTLIRKIDNLNPTYNYYVIGVSQNPSSYYTNHIDYKYILLKTDKDDFFEDYKMFDGINQPIVINTYGTDTFQVPKVNKVYTSPSDGRALIIYSYNGKVYKLYIDTNNETISYGFLINHPSQVFWQRIYRSFIQGNIGEAPFDFMVDLGNGYYFSNGIVYGYTNLDFNPVTYTNISSSDVGRPYYDGRRGEKVWRQRGFVRNVTGGGVVEVLYQTIPDGDVWNNYMAGDTIRAINKDGNKVVILGRKEYLDEYFGKSNLNSWRWYHFVVNNKRYSYIFNTANGNMEVQKYGTKNNPNVRYYDQYDSDSARYNGYTYRNDGLATNIDIGNKVYNINGVSFEVY